MAQITSLIISVTEAEAEQLYQAAQGKSKCPRCAQRLKAEIYYAGSHLNGIYISCERCGFCEG